jgi:hypothetical protein
METIRRSRVVHPTKLVVVAAAALVLFGACGEPSSESGAGGGRADGGRSSGGNPGGGAGGNTGSGDDTVVYEPPGNKPGGGAGGGASGGKALVVDPQPISGTALPSHWEEARIIDDDTIKLFFWSGVEPCHVLDRVDVDYGAKKIGVTIFQGTGLNAADKPCIELAVLKAVKIDLEEPLDGRKVVDGITRRFERP